MIRSKTECINELVDAGEVLFDIIDEHLNPEIYKDKSDSISYAREIIENRGEVKPC